MPEELIIYLEEGVLDRFELEDWTPEDGFDDGFDDDEDYPR
jgi:hypothetical protein